jgi:formylglycine-generating enzyme required for sulfatase activity
MPDVNRKLCVFLCHSSQDKPVIRELFKKLLAEGWLDPWLDEEKLLPGQNWDLEIEKAVETSDAVVVCLSNNSVTKEGYVQRELKYVLDIALEKPEETIFIIPLRLEECTPPRRLRSWQYADYFPPANRDAAFERLLASLKLRADDLDLQIDPAFPGASAGPVEAAEVKPDVYGEMEFMKVPAGKFLMGADKIERGIPYHYWVGRFPVTNQQYSQFHRARMRYYSFPKGRDLHPAGNISRLNADEYVKWLNEHVVDLPSGYYFQLPSESEWEKAARGTNGRIYPWGNELIRACNTREKNIGETTPVGTYSPQSDSPFGAADMAGNVWEWTRSLNQENIGVIKGGSFGDDMMYARCDVRAFYSVASVALSFGMRLAIVPISAE